MKVQIKFIFSLFLILILLAWSAIYSYRTGYLAGELDSIKRRNIELPLAVLISARLNNGNEDILLYEDMLNSSILDYRKTLQERKKINELIRGESTLIKTISYPRLLNYRTKYPIEERQGIIIENIEWLMENDQ